MYMSIYLSYNNNFYLEKIDNSWGLKVVSMVRLARVHQGSECPGLEPATLRATEDLVKLVYKKEKINNQLDVAPEFHVL